MSVPVGQRNVSDTPSNNTCYAVDACLELALHTSKICSNRKYFTDNHPETYSFAIELATTAWLETRRANRLNVDRNHALKDKRLEHQQNAIELLSDLKDWILYCRRLLHLRGSKAGHWYDKTEYALGLVIKWHDSDAYRYRNY